ncbi:MAG: glutaminyl-peptide cyclotransferase, partial [Candidatus Saccharimonas sp.]|nr:glutaminyl-peptide cyclotransferase [Planctomycetaceae bacterium]
MNQPSTTPSLQHPTSRRGRFIALTLLAVGVVGFTAAAQFKREPKGAVAGFRLVAEDPHDATAFTQGLVFTDGRL